MHNSRPDPIVLGCKKPQPNLRNTYYSILFFLIVSPLFTFPALAQPLGSYCIAQPDYKLQLEPTVPSLDEPEPVHITVKGETFHIVIKDRYLKVMDENNSSLSKAGVWQDFGRVHNVVLGKNGWLWIDGDDRGYMVKLDLSQMPPTLGQPVQLPDLKARPYSMIEKWWDYGDYGDYGYRVTGDYSPLLDRVFITGHRVTLFGTPSLATYEVIAGQAKLLPVQLQGARLIGGRRYAGAGSIGIYEDFPHLNGVLLEGQNGDAYFYNGVKVVSLLTDYLDSSTKEKQRGWDFMQAPISQRFFLKNITRQKPFFIEIKAGPILLPIAMPDELTDEWFGLYEFPDDPQLFGISRHVVVAETKDGLRIVATVPEPFYISKEGYVDTNLMPDKAIGFTVFNPVTKTSTEYLIINNPLSERCVATLNTDKSIVFGDK